MLLSSIYAHWIYSFLPYTLPSNSSCALPTMLPLNFIDLFRSPQKTNPIFEMLYRKVEGLAQGYCAWRWTHRSGRQQNPRTWQRSTFTLPENSAETSAFLSKALVKAREKFSTPAYQPCHFKQLQVTSNSPMIFIKDGVSFLEIY